MDRFAANTFRTLAIVFISIFVIGGSLLLLLFALCLGALSSSGPSHQQAELGIGLILGVAVILITAGVFGIGKLSKGIVREVPEYRLPYTPPPVPPVQPREVAVPTSTAEIAASVLPAEVETGPRYDVAAHFSPASRAAIQNLVLAIAGKVAIEILITISAWIWVQRPVPTSIQTLHFSFIAWALAATAPHLVLLYALLKRPGPRAFAYSLVIPALHLFFGFFGHSASIFLFLRANPGIPAVLSGLTLFPWLLDILILHLAWKAIRLTGIQPNSTRLIVASVVIFLYTCLLPAIVGLLAAIMR